MTRVILFSDLDGTFLDHHRYTPGLAPDAWKMLESQGVPLIFCSSKTFAEQTALQNTLGMRQPFILENGSAIALPRGYFSADFYSADRTSGAWDILVLSHADRNDLLAYMAQYPRIRGFSQTDKGALSAATGLKEEALDRACDRWFTETLIYPDEEQGVAPLREQFLRAGWRFSRGGRFFTVQSATADKGKALSRLRGLFQQKYPDAQLHTVAAGDSFNDAPMLAAADTAYQVQAYDGRWADLGVPGLIQIEAPGPEGFSEIVRRMLTGL